MLNISTKKTIIENNLIVAKVKYDDWLSMPDLFILERIRTIKYASKMEKEWKKNAQFKTSENIINCVDVALTNGQLNKINGIIRKGLWEEGGLTKPDTMIIQIHNLENEFYQAFTESLYPLSARNKSQDIVLACYKNHNLNFTSDRLKHGYINDALNIALRGEPRKLQDKRTFNQEINTDKAIKNFKNELILIDKINPDITIFSTGVLAAALLMLSTDQTVIEFFIKLNKYQGMTKDEKQDPIESLLRIIELFKRKPGSTGSEGKKQIELCSKTIRAISAWKLGENEEKYWIKRLSSMDFLPTIRKMKQLKKIHGIKEL